MDIIYPSQCKYGHLFLEKYQFNELTPEGNIGFCWCGFCKTKVMVKPIFDDWEIKLNNLSIFLKNKIKKLETIAKDVQK